jgi:uncharacterized membrane protein YdjX (TVP38/TMEM64 family)
MKTWLKRLAPLLLIAALAISAYSFGFGHLLSLSALGERRETLLRLAHDHFLLTVLAYVGLYIAVVALSLPGATVMSLAGGFIFGWMLGGALVVLAATAGATILFLAARTAVGGMLRRRAGTTLQKVEAGFHQNALNYLLFLRLVPLFPFWVVNLAMALLGMRLLPFVAGTAVGIVPGTFVFTAIGSGLGDVFDAGANPTLADLVSPTLLVALACLGLLALLPVLVRKYQARRAAQRPPLA